jgi:ATP-dependent Clp protease ATP-binding subunit ClpA
MFDRYSNRARSLIVIAFWSARRRGGSYVEPEDLLHAIIREDRGEFAAIAADAFPGARTSSDASTGSHRPFLSESVAATLLKELHEDAGPAKPETPTENREPHVDTPLSQSLKRVLTFAAQHRDDARTIEPLDLLAGIVENRDSALAQLLRDHGITRQTIARALDSGPSTVHP